MDTGNTTWILISSALVLFMTPGLAFFYGGMTRAKNVLNMLMMNFWCLLVVPLLWVVAGYSLAFKGTGGLIGSFDNAFLNHLLPTDNANATELLTMIFLATFASITPALISGAVADRMKFAAWAVFVPVWTLLVYVPVTYWVFAPNGWLLTRGSLDFAGGTSIHVNAGVAALAMVLLIGKRKGWPSEGAPPHSMPLVMLGTGVLWFGWFGFNAGSALAANGIAVQAFVNTFLAAAAAGLAWSVVERVRDGHFTNLGVASGVVAGLVAITPGCAFMGPMSAIAVGLIAGVICSYAISLKVKLGFDDALDVVGVHLVGGLTGSILIGLFADPAFVGHVGKLQGWFFGGNAELLVEQIIANGVTILYSFVATFAIGKVLDLTIGLRVTPDVESEGLDIVEHAETAYNYSERAMGRAH